MKTQARKNKLRQLNFTLGLVALAGGSELPRNDLLGDNGALHTPAPTEAPHLHQDATI